MALRRSFRVLRYITFKHPLATIVVIFCSYFLLYTFADRLPIALEVLNTIMMLFSSEMAVIMLYRQGKPLQDIILRLLLTEAFVFTFDQLVVTGLLRWSWSRELISALSKWGSALIREIKSIISAFFPKNGKSAGPIKRFFRRLFKAHMEPHKAGLKIVFALGLIPKLPPFPIGGLSIGVLVVRYNKYGWRGWIALLSGMLIRNTLWLLGVYGVSSLF